MEGEKPFPADARFYTPDTVFFFVRYFYVNGPPPSIDSGLGWQPVARSIRKLTLSWNNKKYLMIWELVDQSLVSVY
jgi:hypothetical protein